MIDFMDIALREAEKARKKDEVPIGAVIVMNGKVIAKGYNRREKSKNAIKHAEIIAIEKACKRLRSWRLEGAEIYVTLEPCPMCAGAIANARISKLIYASSEKTSSDNLCEKILLSNRLNHKVKIEKGYKSDESSKLLTDFFFFFRKK